MSKFISSVQGIPSYVKTHWNTTNPGEYMTLRDIVFYTIGAMGISGVGQLLYLITFSAGYLCGGVMGISVHDFYIISIVGTIVGYATMFLNPFGILIYENHGHIPKKTARFALTAWIIELVVGVSCYFIPSAPFETIIKGLPQLVGNMLVVGALGALMNWAIRYKFSAKYGRVKPFMIIYAIPTVLLMSAIPYLPVANMDYTTKLVVLHFAFTLLGIFSGGYNVYTGVVQFLSPNSVERQKVISYCALPIGLLSSLYSMFLPVLVATTGGYLNISTYRVYIPILGIIGLALSFFMIPVKERVIEDPQNRPKIKFFSAAKKVFKDKYLWISNISALFSGWTILANEVMNLFFIYLLRKEWLMGLAAAFVSLITSNVSKLLVPTLIKKYEKKNLMIASRVFACIFFACYFIAIKAQSVALLITFCMGRNFFNTIYTQVSMGINADIMDYHQWKTGERADNSSTIFSWFTGPIVMLIGFISPAVLANYGFTSDWDVLYDTNVFSTIMIVYVCFTILGIFFTIFPFFFYDLTREKHDLCIKELEERVRAGKTHEVIGEELAESQESNNEDMVVLKNASGYDEKEEEQQQ